MLYVIRTTNEAGETVYFHSSGCCIYCPELATKYKTRKNATSMKYHLCNEKNYKDVEIIEYTSDIVKSAHQEYYGKGEDFIRDILDRIEK